LTITKTTFPFKLPNWLAQLAGRAPVAPPSVYPRLELRCSGPCLLVEHQQRPEQVLHVTTTLATLDASGARIRVSYIPKTEGEGIAFLKILSGHPASDDPDDSLTLVHELPELGARANYKQVSELVQYVELMASLRQAARTAQAAGPGRITQGAQSGAAPAAAESGQQVRGARLSAKAVFGLLALFVVGLLVVVAVIGDRQIQANKAASAAAPLVQGKPAPIKLSEGDQLNATEKAALAQVVMQSGIELSSGGKAFVIFSDPNCPACRELEGRMATLDKSLSPIVVPVSFKQGSPEAVAGILCSKDALVAWRQAVAGGPPAATCAKGESQAVANNAAFTALRFDRTPTIVTSSGKVAVGVKDYDGLVRWIKENSNGS
jgi:protein-disulfide isomerase